jgi:hypothetical protein
MYWGALGGGRGVMIERKCVTLSPGMLRFVQDSIMQQQLMCQQSGSAKMHELQNEDGTSKG